MSDLGLAAGSSTLAPYGEAIRTERNPLARSAERREQNDARSNICGNRTSRRSFTALQAGADEQLVEAETPEFIGIPEWCRRVGCSRESGYRAARRDEIPGLFRIGRLKRINWSVFLNVAANPSAGHNTVGG
jgi:predicted DNA-binding transcriptional regulator AlpA